MCIVDGSPRIFDSKNDMLFAIEQYRKSFNIIQEIEMYELKCKSLIK